MEETDLLGWVQLNDSDNRRSSDWYMSFLQRTEACPRVGWRMCVVIAMYDLMSCEFSLPTKWISHILRS